MPHATGPALRKNRADSREGRDLICDRSEKWGTWRSRLAQWALPKQTDAIFALAGISQLGSGADYVNGLVMHQIGPKCRRALPRDQPSQC
jgi:hypothetical protein